MKKTSGRTTRNWLFLGIAMAVSAGSAAAGTDIQVDATHPLGPVNRKLFGHNVEAADPRGIYTDTFGAQVFDFSGIKYGGGFWDPLAQKPYQTVVGEARSTGIGMLRYPGGCLASNYDWRKAVGPVSERGDWRFGLDEYIELCRALGAEPLITASDYVLPAEEMPAHLADMVEYLNAPATPEHPWALKRKLWGHPEPYGVKWFELGNESSAGNYYCKPRRCFTPEAYSTYAKTSAAAMRKIDPTIKIGIQEDFGKDAYSSADFIIVHSYCPKINGLDVEDDFKSCMATAEFFGRWLGAIDKKVKVAAGRELPLALTEYNIYYFAQKPVPYRFSAMAGLLCADWLRLLLLPDTHTEIANYWQISNGYFGMIWSTNGVITGRNAVLPFIQLWGGHFGGSLLPVEVKGAPRFEAPASETTPAARGDVFVEAAKVGDVDPGAFTFDSLKEVNVEGSSKGKGELTFKLNGLSKECYINFALFPNTIKGSELYYRVNFESRFVPEAETHEPTPANLGLSLLDARGWAATESAVAADGLGMDKVWKAHSMDFGVRKDCSAVNVVFRAPNVARPTNGILEVRKFKIETWSPAIEPAYPGLTATSSLSTDGKTLHLIVFNKSFDTEIETVVTLKGFVPKSATAWTAADEPETIEYKEPVKAEVALPPPGRPLKLKFPAHSMTAIDFRR